MIAREEVINKAQDPTTIQAEAGGMGSGPGRSRSRQNPNRNPIFLCPASVSSPLLDLIRSQGLLDDLQLEEVIEEHNRSGKPFQKSCRTSAFWTWTPSCSDRQSSGHRGGATERPRIDAGILSAIPADAARMYKCLPVAVYDSTVQLAWPTPLNPAARMNWPTSSASAIVPGRGRPRRNRRAVSRFTATPNPAWPTSSRNWAGQRNRPRSGRSGRHRRHRRPETLANETPIIRFVNLVLFQAVQDRASDIHFEPFETNSKSATAWTARSTKCRRRQTSGAAGHFPHQSHVQPGHFGAPPAAGRTHQHADRRTHIDLRVSTLPTQFGESVVLRVLDRSAVNLDIKSLGCPSRL
jgi:type IV pilus assembly protein PilB